MIKKVFINQVSCTQNASRVKVLQLLECCIIVEIMPFICIMNVNFDSNCVFYQSVEENLKSFSQRPFLSHFLYFFILFQIIN